MKKKITIANVIDIEATCDKNQRWDFIHDVIEFGVTEVNLEEHRIIRSESILVKPTKSKITPFCTELTTITPELVAENGCTFKYAIIQLQDKFWPINRIFASWGDYDRKQIREQCGRENTLYPFSDSLHLNVKALFAAKFGEKCGVFRACDILEIPFEGTQHRGIDDSKNIAKILLKLL